MSKYPVYFQEKRIDNADLEWGNIPGVMLSINANDDHELFHIVSQQIVDAAEYQLVEHGIEAAYRGTWVDDQEQIHDFELVPDSMWNESYS